MFTVQFFVDDKRLGECLRLLTGLAYGQPVVKPVTNIEGPGKRGNGTLRARTPNGSRAEMLTDYIKRNKLTVVTAKDCKAAMKESGFGAASNLTNVLQQVEATGFIKRYGKRGTGNVATYKVVE